MSEINKIKNNLIIELHVPDLDIIKNFYSLLGFKVSLDDAVNEKKLGYLTMTRNDELGNTMLNFYGGDERIYNQSFFKQFPRDTKRGYAAEVTITVYDIEALYKIALDNIKDSIVRGLIELEDHEHKWRDFRIVDPFGFYIRFTELVDWGQL